MIIKIENVNVYFDELPNDPCEGQKVFISHLSWLTEKNLPKIHQKLEIYTSHLLKSQLILFISEFPTKTIRNGEIIILPTYKVTELSWDDKRINVLMCSAAGDLTGSVMFLFTKDNQIEHFYIGGFTFYSYFFNYTKIEELMKLATNNLYLYLECAEKIIDFSKEKYIYDLLKNAKHDNKNKPTLLMFARFGYENLIAKILEKYTSSISVLSNLKSHLKQIGYMKEPELYCGKDILIASAFTDNDLAKMERNYFEKFRCIAILPEHNSNYDEYNFTQIIYATLPHLQHFQVLCSFKFSHIFGISNGPTKNTPIPECLNFLKDDSKKSPQKENQEKVMQVSPIYKIQKRCLDYLDEEENSL